MKASSILLHFSRSVAMLWQLCPWDFLKTLHSCLAKVYRFFPPLQPFLADCRGAAIRHFSRSVAFSGLAPLLPKGKSRVRLSYGFLYTGVTVLDTWMLRQYLHRMPRCHQPPHRAFGIGISFQRSMVELVLKLITRLPNTAPPSYIYTSTGAWHSLPTKLITFSQKFAAIPAILRQLLQ